ncbi:MAG: TetR family transcriptional regulator [Thermoleophilia bacterium]|nr:TetR family transcriptional regulator [Thermoleophilia bacterium]
MRALTIQELEAASGVPRSTIYFYVREGYLPPGQKAAATRAIYSDEHVALLEEIKRLKASGHSMDRVKAVLHERIGSTDGASTDLVAQQAQRTRERILEVAARQFAHKGYRRTRIADVIREAGVSPLVFYAHFGDKRQLFARSFSVFFKSSVPFVEELLAGEKDPVMRMLLRTRASFGLQAMSDNMFWLARFEAFYEGEETSRAARDSQKLVLDRITADLVLARRGNRQPSDVSDELLAYGLHGALQVTAMRASWDDTYSKADVMWTHLLLHMAIWALCSGELDVTKRVDRYRTEVERLASLEPPTLPSPLRSSRDPSTPSAEQTPHAGRGLDIQERVLEVAAREFARNGYRRTRVTDVIHEVGISPPVFYTYFRTKPELLARSFDVLNRWWSYLAEEQLAGESDPIIRILSRIRACFGLQAMSDNLLWLARFEALHEGGEARKAAQDSLKRIFGKIGAELSELRQQGGPQPDVSDELMACSLHGALEISNMIASWDNKYSRRDMMYTHLHLYLAVRAMYSGELNVAELADRYRDDVERLAALPLTPLPPSM